MQKKQVILVTDGDVYAKKTIQYVASHYGGRCISASFGNPTLLTGEELVKLILQAKSEPVFVMFDDSGFLGEGAGERALKYVATHPQMEVLGVIAVASKTHQSEWTKVHITVDRDLQVSSHGVDKSGIQEMDIGRINGDTVYCLDELHFPLIVGIGDIGKMARKDDISRGAPITSKAVEIILEGMGTMSHNGMEKVPISPKLTINEKFFKDEVGLDVSFDLGVRKITVLKKELNIYYVNGLCDTMFIIEIMEELLHINDFEKKTYKVKEIVHNRLVNQQVNEIEYMDEVVDQVLSGLIVILLEGEESGFVIDTRSYPGRNPEEPDTEKVVRGARDGYVENIIVNTALTRRRIRDERLRYEMFQVGERSKTDICLAYIKDVADEDLVDIVRKETKNIDIDGLTMADKTVEEFIVKQGFNPYPLVRYTERPDIAATHLLEGHVIVMVDTSPSVIITPTTFFHHVQHVEEYRQSPAVGTFVRWVRFLGIFASLFLLPLWFLMVLEPGLLPEPIGFVGPNEESNIPIVFQIFLADIGIEFLRLAAIHTPTALSTAMGLIAAVLIGQIAIDVGLFVPEVILYVAVAAIGSFTTPSYELSVANKIVRLILLVLVALFHVPGLVVGVTIFVLFLAGTRSLNTPYLWPFIPFSPKALFIV